MRDCSIFSFTLNLTKIFLPGIFILHEIRATVSFTQGFRVKT